MALSQPEKWQTERFVLEGRVQGVGCRAQVKRLASRLIGLSGLVRNLSDGTVEVIASGEIPQLRHFEKALRTGLRRPVVLVRLTVVSLPDHPVQGSGFVIADDA